MTWQIVQHSGFWVFVLICLTVSWRERPNRHGRLSILYMGLGVTCIWFVDLSGYLSQLGMSWAGQVYMRGQMVSAAALLACLVLGMYHLFKERQALFPENDQPSA